MKVSLTISIASISGSSATNGQFGPTDASTNSLTYSKLGRAHSFSFFETFVAFGFFGDIIDGRFSPLELLVETMARKCAKSGGQMNEDLKTKRKISGFEILVLAPFKPMLMKFEESPLDLDSLMEH